MAKLDSVIRIESELRPCIVYEKKCLFHKWINVKNLLGNDCTLGLVENENGQLETAPYSKIRFIDNKIYEYAFDERSDENEK